MGTTKGHNKGVTKEMTEITSTPYCVCDSCGEEIGEHGYLLQDKLGLRPRRILRCRVCYNTQFRGSENMMVVMSWK